MRKDQSEASAGRSNKKSEPGRKRDALRERAEKVLSGKRSPMAHQDAQKVLHELEVHQIELEIQNEALREAQETASQAEGKYAELYDFAPIAYFTFDRNGLIKAANLTGVSLLGHERSHLIGKPFAVFVTPAFINTFFLHRQTLFKTGTKRTDELQLVRKDGSIFYASVTSVPVQNAEGNVTECRSVVTDVTERKRMEEALQKAHDELELRVQERTRELQNAYQKLTEESRLRERVEEQLREAQKMEAIGTLAGGIAHDFNNTLASILGFTEMAVEKVSDRPDVEKSLNNVLKSTLRARDLVKQILAFSRKTSYARRPISLSPLIKETVQLLRASIPTTVEIVLNMTARSDTILAAPAEVQQILMILGSNASLAMQEKGGTLDISLNDIDFPADSPVLEQSVAPGAYVQLVVKDTGVGMVPDVMNRVFEPFFTTRGVGKGTGMGLAVVYGIVKSLTGAITVESEPAVGSTFRIFLPKVKTEAKAEPAKTVAAGGHERILFVDDEDLLAELNSERLKSLGYEVVTTTNSREALALFKAEPERFDLVITDYTMPHLTGIDLARQLLTIREGIPIILCTGCSDAVSPAIVKKAGIREFLMKPLSKQELAEAIRRVLGSKTGA